MEVILKVEAKTIEEYFKKADDREDTLRQLDTLIQEAAPHLKRQLFDGMSINMIAYGLFHYKTKSGSEGDWPVVALANQKNYISVYICVVHDGTYIPEQYEAKLGKVNIGKSCIRFKKLDDVNTDVLREAIATAATLQANNSNEFGV